MNTKPKHTPGPWAIGIDSDDERTQVIASDGGHIAYVEYSPTVENARLIAAAPEMLEALKSLAAWDDDREEGEPTDCEMLDDLTQRIEAARAIIRKAEVEES